MTQYLIMCRSLTKAQSSARLLESAGITASVVKAPQELSVAGCGYALRIWASEIEPATALLNERQIPIRRVYLQKNDGVLEEVSHDLP